MARWLPVRGYKGLYLVSTTGKVKSLPRTVKGRGNIQLKIPGRILKLSPRKNGYISVTLHKKGKQVTRAVHRLVLEAFVGPRPPGKEACHFPDRNKSNNHLSNLRWGTSTDNHQDMITHGTHYKPPLGENHPLSKLTDKQTEAIRRRLQNPYQGLNRELARKYGVSDGTICDIKMGRIRKDH